MAGINQVIRFNRTRMAEYRKRQRAVAAAFKQMPRGSKTRAGFDLKISPATISAVVNGNRLSVATLTLVEAWLVIQDAIAQERQIKEDAPDNPGRPRKSRKVDAR